MGPLLVVVRLAVAGLLVFGPWADQPAELSGWDVDRFQEIADTPGRAWRDHPVEYPPGSVVVIELLAGDDVVETHRRIVLVTLVVDLAVAAGLAHSYGRRAAGIWLVVGLMLLPAPYLRLDLLASALALLAVVALERRRPGLAGATLVAAGLIKVWPAVLLVAWVAARQWRAVAVAVVAGCAALAAWLAWAGTGAVEQVLGYRGATGWHVESVPGVVAGWGDPGSARLEQGAFRWGDASAGPKLALLALFALVAVAVLRRATSAPPSQHLAAVALVAGLLVTSPLLSPQYLVWLLAFVALAGADGEDTVVSLTAVAAALTTGLLAVVGPEDVDGPVAQAILLARNLLLIALAATALGRLRGSRWAPGALPAQPAAPT